MLANPDLYTAVGLPTPRRIIAGHRHRFAKGIKIQRDPFKIGGDRGGDDSLAHRLGTAQRDVTVGKRRTLPVAETRKQQTAGIVLTDL